MIRLLVYETDSRRKSQVRDILVKLSVSLDEELDLYWLHGDNMIFDARKYLSEANIAIISAELDCSLDAALEAHSRNSLCRILLYAEGKTDILQFIPSGLVSYCEGPGNRLSSEIVRLINEVQADKNIFRFTSRRENRFISFSQILYFSSDLRYVDVFTSGGNSYRYIEKLDNVEKALSGKNFVRIHKSYLVNLRAVHGIDFTTHSVLISNGEKLPCSAKYYHDVSERIRRQD